MKDTCRGRPRLKKNYSLYSMEEDPGGHREQEEGDCDNVNNFSLSTEITYFN